MISARHVGAIWRYAFRGLLVILGVATVFDVSRDLRWVLAGLLVAMVSAEVCQVVLGRRRQSGRR